MVQQAILFKPRPPHRKCSQEINFDPARILPSGGQVSIIIQSDGCLGKDTEVNTLEHVQVCVSLSSVCRGDLSVQLESPAGTVSVLLAPRRNDDWTGGLRNWTLMTVHSWGETPHGPWALKVTDHLGTVEACVREGGAEVAAGALLSLTLTLYGTSHRPPRVVEPQPGVVSMGAYHPVSQRGVLVRNRAPPHDLVQWAYAHETRRKVGTADIPAPRHRKDHGLASGPLVSFRNEEMDDTDGAELGDQLRQLWNTLRDRLEKHWRPYQEDVALRNFRRAGLPGGEEPLEDVHNMQDGVGGAFGSAPPPDRKLNLDDRNHLP
ncbi:endoprotease bli-4-like isoform X2 [Hypomesus transpacificus]|uniref:endoprotease bli-4-like isoform X2 n=1 Tax=Hypomesus transpacificus TaxID=137520 RepID=UPI001F082A8B|nr:endoprotease bli-4-like isoform X2 [Hypomesus transpacificus]